MSKKNPKPGQGDQTMPKTTRLFLPIRKVDEEQRLVYGVITEEVLDKAGEIMDYEGSRPLFEKWSQGIAAATEGKSYGNVRVMHTNKVAGVLNQELVFDDEAKTIEACAKVIDDTEWAMVLAGGYTGFSIGGRYQKRWEVDGQKRFIAEPVEVSLVDNPCVPTATFSFVKADGTEEEVAFALWAPSSEEVAAHATELAKAAGAEASWPDYIEQAREELLKAHTGDEDADEDQDDADKTAGDDGEKPEEDDEAKAADKEADADSDDEETPKEESDDDDEAQKAAVLDGIVQVWQATDGKTFVKKADCATHQEALLAEPAQDPLSKALAGLRADLSGEEPNEASDPETASILTAGEEVSKWHGILTQARETFDEHLVAKGLYQVGRLAELMESLGYVCSSACWEREAEKDQSPVPEMLAQNLVGLGAALVIMAQEEVSEMIMEMQARGLDVDTIISTAPELAEMSAGVTMVKTAMGDLEKAGARHNKTDKEKLKDVYRILKELGVDDEETTEKLNKLAATEQENERLNKVITDAVPAIEEMRKDIAALKAQPMPSAPAANTVVTKGLEDGELPIQAPVGDAALSAIIEKYGASNLARAAIKDAQQRPLSMFNKG